MKKHKVTLIVMCVLGVLTAWVLAETTPSQAPDPQPKIRVGTFNSRVLALASLSLSPEDVWFVGDNLEWDVSAPQKLGIFGIWNDFKGLGLPPSSEIVPDRIINNISELIK